MSDKKNDKKNSRQVSLAGAAGKKKSSSKKKIGKKGMWIALGALVVVIVLLIVLLAGSCQKTGQMLTGGQMVQYTVTPEDKAADVSYYALGVLGKNSTDRMDMCAVLCYDRKAGKATILQLPVTAYLGEDGSFSATVVGDVWGNPKPITWCNTCRGKVAEQDVDGDKHKGCGSKLTTKKGSAFTDYSRVFNAQYGLPIDNYLVIPRAGLAKLIDAVGGVDMQVSGKFTLDDVTYDKGVRTLSGEAAVYYAVEYNYNKTPASDVERMMRQRQLFASLLDRLSRYEVAELYNEDETKADILSNIILGADPIRYDTTSFGKSRLMGISEKKAENVKYIEAMARFMYDISHVSKKNITYCLAPGTAVKHGTSYVFSVHKEQTISLLKQYMNPYGLTMDGSTVAIPELKVNPADADTAVTTLDKVLVKATQ